MSPTPAQRADEAAAPVRLEEAPLRSLRQYLRRAAPWLGGFVLVLVLARALLFETVPVNGPSMEPTLRDGDRVLVWKLPTLLSRLPAVGGFEPFNQADIVVFQGDRGDHRRYVKRVVARGPVYDGAAHADDGAAHLQTFVQVENDQVFVNNRRLDEPYLTPERAAGELRDTAQVAPGEYYVMGDHRAVSRDSRRFGPVRRARAIGEAVAVLWPPQRAGAL